MRDRLFAPVAEFQRAGHFAVGKIPLDRAAQALFDGNRAAASPSSRAAFETSAQVVGTSAGWTGRYSICGFLPINSAIWSMIAFEHHHAGRRPG